MTRLDPSQLKDGAKEATEKKRTLARESDLLKARSEETRIRPASATERDRVWAALTTAALNNESRVSFKRLNISEQNFIRKLGFIVESTNQESIKSWLDTHLQRYESELQEIDRSIRFIEREDPLSESLLSLERHRTYVVTQLNSLRRPASPLRKKAKPVSTVVYDVEIKEPETNVSSVDTYNIQSLFWLLGDGQGFFSHLEKKFEKSASLGEFFEILTARPSGKYPQGISAARNQPFTGRHTRGWVANEHYYQEDLGAKYKTPWVLYDYFSEEQSVAERGPEPRALRYFLELLGYKCTLKLKKDESVLKVRWP
jgi:hypothetical protein